MFSMKTGGTPGSASWCYTHPAFAACLDLCSYDFRPKGYKDSEIERSQ